MLLFLGTLLCYCTSTCYVIIVQVHFMLVDVLFLCGCTGSYLC